MRNTLQILLMCVGLVSSLLLPAQNFTELIANAEQAYQAKNHQMAGQLYLKAFSSKDFQNISKNHFYNAACVFALQNEAKQALELLQKAAESGWRDAVWMQKDSDLTSIRKTPEWAAILEKVNANMQSFEASLKYPKLRKELLKMKEDDQKYRRFMLQVQQEKNKGALEQMIVAITELDTKHTTRMEEIVTKIGWPKISEVGEDGSQAAWVLVQHADKRPDFQNKCLDLLKEAINSQEANSSNFAYLHDRVQVAYNEKQTYATQTQQNILTNQLEFCPIKDEHLVNEKRKEMGLIDVVVFAQKTGINYKILSESAAKAKANAEMEEYINLTAKAEISYEDGDYENAQRFYRRMMQLAGNIETEDIYKAACAAAMSQNEKKSAFYFLNKAILEGWNDLPKLKIEKAFQSLHNMPEWAQLIQILQTAKQKQ